MRFFGKIRTKKQMFPLFQQSFPHLHMAFSPGRLENSRFLNRNVLETRPPDTTRYSGVLHIVNPIIPGVYRLVRVFHRHLWKNPLLRYNS